MISEEDPPRESPPDDLDALIRSPASRKFIQPPNWLSRIKSMSQEYLIDRILDNLSQIITKYLNNVVQVTVESDLTVEKISQRQDCKEAIRNGKREFTFQLETQKLHPFKPWVEFVPKLGGVGVVQLTFEYEAKPEIAAKDVRVTILNDHLSGVSIGSLDVSIEMSMLVNDIPVNLGTINRKLNVQPGLDRIAELFKSAIETAKQPDLSLAGESRFCVKCGASIARDDYFCTSCGAKQ